MSGRTFGTLRWKGPEPGVWAIKADADVAMRLKRMFPQVQGSRTGTITLSATEETARDLAWVMTRWPLDMSAPTKRRLNAGARAHKAREERVLEVLSGRVSEPGEGFLAPATPLRAYQAQARDLVWLTSGVLLADELGLGKTLSGLSLLENPACRPALAVTLPGLAGQWQREAGKFYPGLKTHILKKSTPYDLRDENGDNPDIIISSYAKLAGWSDHLAGRVRTVIFDEVQELRRDGSQRYRAAQQIAHSAEFKAGLSASPILGYGGGEAWNILDILRPGMLGDRAEFGREWCGSSYGLDAKTRLKNPAALNQHLTTQGALLRRTREDVGIYLPPITTIEQSVPSDSAVLRDAESNATEIARIILAANSSTQQRWSAAGDLDWRLRQATGIAKAPFVADFVRLIAEAGEKVVLFGWHREVYDIWLERLASLNPVLYTGTESPSQKEKSFQRFVDGDAQVLIMSLRSGAGLDGLQGAAETVVFGELDWSPGVHKQGVGRLGRPGQTRPVMAYYCVSDEGSDPYMLDVLNIKAIQADGLIAPSEDNSVDELSKSDRIKQLAANLLAKAGIAADHADGIAS